jgi:hypothetical protein
LTELRAIFASRLKKYGVVIFASISMFDATY